MFPDAVDSDVDDDDDNNAGILVLICIVRIRQIISIYHHVPWNEFARTTTQLRSRMCVQEKKSMCATTTTMTTTNDHLIKCITVHE